MQVTRSAPIPRQTVALARQLSELGGACVGCRSCPGLCRDLADALMLPDFVLGHRDSRAARPGPERG